MAFGERDLTGKAPLDPGHHRAILALSTAFWDAELRGNENARAWLNGEGAKSVPSADDKWERNRKAGE